MFSQYTQKMNLKTLGCDFQLSHFELWRVWSVPAKIPSIARPLERPNAQRRSDSIKYATMIHKDSRALHIAQIHCVTGLTIPGKRSRHDQNSASAFVNCTRIGRLWWCTSQVPVACPLQQRTGTSLSEIQPDNARLIFRFISSSLIKKGLRSLMHAKFERKKHFLSGIKW